MSWDVEKCREDVNRERAKTGRPNSTNLGELANPTAELNGAHRGVTPEVERKIFEAANLELNRDMTETLGEKCHV